MTSNQEIDPNSIVARIISELENQPGVRPLLLRTLLTDEFLAMPARLIRMDDDISVLKTDVAELKTDVAELKTDVVDLKTDMTSVKNDLGYLKGQDLEHNMEKLAHGRLTSHLNLRNVRILWGPTAGAMPDDFYDAIRANGLTTDQRERIIETDLIIRGTERDTGQRIYAAVEASFTVNESDVDRARLTADILGQVFPDDPMVAAVYGVEFPEQLKERADNAGVLVFLTPR